MYDTKEKLFELHEGRVAHVYQDSLGYWTIGVGHLVDPRKGGRLPDHIIDALLDWDMSEKWRELTTALPWVLNLDPVRQAVLHDMAFNLGITGLLGFKNTLQYIRDGKYLQAARHMEQSLWARQVKSRATRLIKMMETGQWPES